MLDHLAIDHRIQLLADVNELITRESIDPDEQHKRFSIAMTILGLNIPDTPPKEQR